MPQLKPAIRNTGHYALKGVRLLLPLVVIGVGIYVVYNYPALKARFSYAINKPNTGDPNKLPKFIGGQAPPGVDIPIGTSAQCGNHPVKYNKDGNPELICDNYIYIPNIGVAAPMVDSTNPNPDVINDELLKGVVHYPGTAWPGEQGNVFLTGHSSYYWWGNSEYKTVFTLTPKLTGGDLVIIYRKGIRYTYKVTEGYEVSPNHVDVLKPTAVPTLTLSTCVPVGTSLKRHIIRAVQIEPDPQRNKAAAPKTKTPTKLPGVR